MGRIGSRVTEELSLDNTQFTNDHATVHEEVLGHDQSHGTPPTHDVTTVETVAPSITQSIGTSLPPPTKRTRKISSTLADYNFVLPPSLVPSQPTPPSVNSTVKYNSDGSVEHYKARLVAKGFTQVEGIDFYETLHRLPTIGYQQSHADHSLFTSCHGKSLVAILIYVDDVIITGTDSTRINFLKRYLDDKFHIKDLGRLKYFLGIEVARSPTGIALCQRKYVLDILVESGMMGNKPTTFPMEQHHQLIAGSGEPCEDPRQYQRLDAPLTQRSTSRYIVFLGSSPISWKAKKQTVISRSSAEAEYRTMATVTTEIIWLIQLLRDFGVICSIPVSLLCDNQLQSILPQIQFFMNERSTSK
ncbi:Reverse transcriptase [Theobroma cacao]|nr:Reverse transcriptase [Theobroma cacao]